MINATTLSRYLMMAFLALFLLQSCSEEIENNTSQSNEQLSSLTSTLQSKLKKELIEKGITKQN